MRVLGDVLLDGRRQRARLKGCEMQRKMLDVASVHHPRGRSEAVESDRCTLLDRVGLESIDSSFYLLLSRTHLY